MKGGTIVELAHDDFEFKHKEKSTGHFARGIIVKWYDENKCLVELFCNGRKCRIDKRAVHIKKLEPRIVK